MVSMSGYAEWMAERIVGELEGVQLERLDVPGAGDMLCDFRFSSSESRTGVVEATTCTDRTLIELQVQLQGDEIIEAPALRHTWWLWLARDAHVGRVQEHVVAALERLEAEGWGTFYYGDDPEWPYHLERQDGASVVAKPESVVALRRLGVRSGHPQPANGDARVVMHPPTQETGANPEIVVAAAEREAKANAEKLAAAEGQERHLFVWVDAPRRFDVEFSISSQPASDGARAPSLPSGTTDLWVAADALFGHAMRGREDREADIVVWRSRQGQGWQHVNVDVPLDERPPKD